jgi:hypothetical protein
MERIGIAASKMAKGNLLLYNSYVVLITILFSLLLYFIAGSSIVLSLIVIGSIVSGISPALGEQWLGVTKVCMIALTVVVGIISLFAILRNIKISKSGSLQEWEKDKASK